MGDTLKGAQHTCNKIQDECKKNAGKSLELATLASKKITEADDKRLATQIGGGVGSGLALAGATATGLVVGGVVLSGIAGFFTFGIGTVVGLSLVGGGAAVAGGAGAIGAGLTAASANSLYKVSEELQKLKEQSKAMSDDATLFDAEVINLQSNIEQTVTILKRLEQRSNELVMKEEVTIVVCQTLDRLDNSAESLNESVAKCKGVFEELEEQLKKINVDI